LAGYILVLLSKWNVVLGIESSEEGRRLVHLLREGLGDEVSKRGELQMG
jgi:hypothetical protein